MSVQGVPRHWHLTREVKDRGECAACDVEWAKYDALLKAGAVPHDEPERDISRNGRNP